MTPAERAAVLRRVEAAQRALPPAETRATPPAPPPQPAAPAKASDDLDALASLEEEMAKLLGRPGPGR